MRVLVTGAGGMLGTDLCADLRARGHEVIATDVREQEGITPLDITDTHAVLKAVRAAKPDAIVHCAAWTDVDGAERNPDPAYRVNALGSWNMAAAAAAVDDWIVGISTDFVDCEVAQRLGGNAGCEKNLQQHKLQTCSNAGIEGRFFRILCRSTRPTSCSFVAAHSRGWRKSLTTAPNHRASARICVSGIVDQRRKQQTNRCDFSRIHGACTSDRMLLYINFDLREITRP